MGEPIFWAVLASIVIAGGSARLVARRPLWPGRSSAIRPAELALAGVSVLVLVFHCAAMFFAPWIDVVPFLEAPAAAVRALGPVSQAAYWLPALGAVVALRRVWPPALGLLVVTLAGVGVTMFWWFELTTHLAWIAAAVLTLAAIFSALVAPRERAGTGL